MSIEQKQQYTLTPEEPIDTLRQNELKDEKLSLTANTQRKLGNFATMAVLGLGSISWTLSGQVEATNDACTDVAHQQIVAESGARAALRSVLHIGEDNRQTVDTVAERLSVDRGYHISGAQLSLANRASESLANEKFVSGVHCIDIPGPVYAGFYATETDDSLRSIAHSHGISVKELRAFNPSLRARAAEEPLEVGLTLRVNKHIDTRYVYREMTDEEANIATLTAGRPKLRRELLRRNETLIVAGERVEAGAEAWLPLRSTEWLEDQDIKQKTSRQLIDRVDTEQSWMMFLVCGSRIVKMIQ